MSKHPPQLPHIGLSWIALALLLAAGAGFWMAQRSGGTRPSVITPVPALNKGAPHAGSAASPPQPSHDTVPPPVSFEVPKVEEEKLHHWLTESETTEDAAAAMLADWRNLSEPGKVAASRHLANLVADDKFSSLQPLLLGPDTSREVKDVLFADMLNRPNVVKWPIICEIMKQKTHPLSSEARSMLAVVLGADYGDDWAKWQERVKNDLSEE